MVSLYERDYFKLTEEEIIKKAEIIERNTTKHGNLEIYNCNMHFELPKAVRHNDSLFPNNYMDYVDLYNYKKMKALNELYLNEIENDDATELSIKNVIGKNKLYHIIGSILKGGQYHFGHHNLYIFPEFELGSSYKVDYLLVGLSSGGHQFVFVEMEHPNKNIVLRDGNFGEAIRKGINQVNDWRIWLDSNFSTLYEIF